MGLDAYLMWSKDFEAARKREDAYDKASEAAWKKVRGEREYDDLTEAEKKKASAACDRLKKKFKQDDDKEERTIERDSKKYPDHMFKIGYMRSSYNPGGINSILGNLTGKDLYWIFKKEGGGYHFKPDWVSVLTRAKTALKELKREAKENPFGVVTVGRNPFSTEVAPVKSGNDALEIFKKRRARYNKDVGEWVVKGSKGWRPSGNYGCKEGDFRVDDGLEVYAMIPGSQMNGKSECVYLVYRVKPDKDEDKGMVYGWYIMALEVVVEMCEWVLAQKDDDKYTLRWSA